MVQSWLTGRRMVSLPFSDHCDPLVNDEIDLDQLLLALTRKMDGGRWKYFELRPLTRPSRPSL